MITLTNTNAQEIINTMPKLDLKLSIAGLEHEGKILPLGTRFCSYRGIHLLPFGLALGFDATVTVAYSTESDVTFDVYGTDKLSINEHNFLALGKHFGYFS